MRANDIIYKCIFIVHSRQAFVYFAAVAQDVRAAFSKLFASTSSLFINTTILTANTTLCQSTFLLSACGFLRFSHQAENQCSLRVLCIISKQSVHCCVFCWAAFLRNVNALFQTEYEMVVTRTTKLRLSRSN